MNIFEGAGSKQNPVIEELQDYDNASLREMLEAAEIIKPGDLVTSEDFDAVKSRALVLAKESQVPVSAEALIYAAFTDRMKLIEKLGDAAIKGMSDEALRGMLYVSTQEMPTDEELTLLRNSPLSVEEWIRERASLKGKNADFAVAVEDDAVIARGSSSEEALRKGQDARAS